MKINLKSSVLAAGAALGLLFTTSAQAALVLNLDPTTKEFWFTGSATGTRGAAGLAAWNNSGVGGLPSASLITANQISGVLTPLSEIGVVNTPRGNVAVGLDLPPGTVTLTGLGPGGVGSKGS